MFNFLILSAKVEIFFFKLYVFEVVALKNNTEARKLILKAPFLVGIMAVVVVRSCLMDLGTDNRKALNYLKCS